MKRRREDIEIKIGADDSYVFVSWPLPVFPAVPDIGSASLHLHDHVLRFQNLEGVPDGLPAQSKLPAQLIFRRKTVTLFQITGTHQLVDPAYDRLIFRFPFHRLLQAPFRVRFNTISGGDAHTSAWNGLFDNLQ